MSLRDDLPLFLSRAKELRMSNAALGSRQRDCYAIITTVVLEQTTLICLAEKPSQKSSGVSIATFREFVGHRTDDAIALPKMVEACEPNPCSCPITIVSMPHTELFKNSLNFGNDR
jgi:hypothetical protein